MWISDFVFLFFVYEYVFALSPYLFSIFLFWLFSLRCVWRRDCRDQKTMNKNEKHPNDMEKKMRQNPMGNDFLKVETEIR